jgi:hypothetical protein
MKRLEMGGPKKMLTTIVVVILLLGFAGASGFFYWQYRTLLSKSSDAEVASLLKEVSTLMVLPESTPTVATIADKTKLEGQEVFKKAENGDKLLIYLDVQKAILYRPSIKKIIDVVPIRTTGNVAGESTEKPVTQDSTQQETTEPDAAPSTPSGSIRSTDQFAFHLSWVQDMPVWFGTQELLLHYFLLVC